MSSSESSSAAPRETDRGGSQGRRAPGMQLTYVVLRLLKSEDERPADRKFPSYVIEIS